MPDKERRQNMKRIKQIFGVGVICALILFLWDPVHAGFYFESEQVAEGISGQPDQEILVKNYLTAGASRTDTNHIITILDFRNMMSYELNAKDQTYTRRDMRTMNDMAKMGPAERQQLDQMMKQMADSTKIVPTDETEAIAGYNCRKYDVQFMMAKGVYWVTTEIKGYQELKKLIQDMGKALEQNPMAKQMNIMGMLDQIDGFPVKTVMDVMGGKVTTTLKMIEQRPLDKSLFEIPKGYRLVEKQ